MPRRNHKQATASRQAKRTLTTLFGEFSSDTKFWIQTEFTAKDLKNDGLLRSYLEDLQWQQFPKFSPIEIARRRLEGVEWATMRGDVEAAMMILNGPDKLPQFRARWERGLWPAPQGPSMGPDWLKYR